MPPPRRPAAILYCLLSWAGAFYHLILFAFLKRDLQPAIGLSSPAIGWIDGVTFASAALGGFVLPIAFGIMNDLTNVWTSCFMLLFALVATALTWMHFAIRMMERRKMPELRGPKYLPELEQALEANHRAAAEPEGAAPTVARPAATARV